MAQIILNVKLNDKVSADVEKISKAFENIKIPKNAANNLSNLTNQVKKTVPNVDNLRKKYANLLTTIQGTEKYYKKGTFTKITSEAKANLEVLKKLNPTTADYAKQVEKLEKNLQSLERQTAETKAETKSLHGSFQEIAAGFLKFQLSAMVVMKPLNLIRQAWASINETLQKTEDAVIALQRVLPSGSASDQDVANKLYDLAQKYGQTFENASAIATNFARTGMSWADTIKATESALLALNVAELDATQASDGMIAIMQQFGLEASDLTDIVDKLNKTADNYAVTTDKLLTALQRTGSSAKNANLTLEETLGLITALSEATGRSGENLGTAVNSLIQYSSKSGSLDIFASLDEKTSDVVGRYRKGAATILDVWQEVSRVINTMDSRQESILSGLINDDDIKNLETELQDELGDIFETVSDVYGTANTFRKNYFIALLGNMQTVNDAIATAQDAQGYSQQENEKYLDTYTAKVNKLQAAWQKMANDEQGLLGIKKALVDLGTGLITIINYAGGLRTVFLALGTAVWAVFGNKIVNNIKKMGSSLKQMFVELKAGAISLNSVLGVIGIIATTISLIDGIVSNFKKEDTTKTDIQESADNLENLSNKLSQIDADSKKTKNQLSALNDILSDENSTTEQVSRAKADLLNIQNDLIDNNKNYLSSIDLINSSYQEQLVLLDKISETQKRDAVNEWISKNQTGINVAEGYLNNPIDELLFSQDTQSVWADSKFQKWLKEKGYSAYSGTEFTGIGDFFKTGFYGLVGGGAYNTIIKTDGKKREEIVNLLNDLYKTAKSEGNNDIAAIISYELAQMQESYDNARNLIYGDKSSSNWIEKLTQEQREQFANGALSWAEIKDILGITEDVVDVTKTWEEQSSNVLRNYEDILDTVNKMLNAEQSILDVEEKKKALEDARNNRNVRVFNATTGNWELQADQKAIDKAEKEYENAVWNNLQNEIKEGNLAVGEIFDKVKDISEDLPNLANIIRDALIKEGYNVPAFDNGGVLSGLGGIKATMGDEIVLPPSIAHKILQPTSNEQFSQFCKDLRLLFGTSKQVMDMKNGMVTTTNNADNSVNNSNNSYIVNGVPFSKETAEKHTLVELFEMAADFQN